MKNAITAALLIIVLSLTAITSGLLKTAFADSVVGNPIPVSVGPYNDLFDPDNHVLYVASGNHFSVGGDAGNVTVINTTNNRPITNITEPFHHTPRDLAYDPVDKKLFVADVYSNTVTVINTTSNTVIDSVPAGSITDGVVYDSSNGDVYAINAGSPVTVIKASDDHVIGSITVGSNSLGGVFDPANGEVYVFNQNSGSVSVINGATNTVLTTIHGLPSPVAGAYDSANGKIYVANYDSGGVSIIDTSSNALVNTVPGNGGLAGSLFDPDNNLIYVSDQGHQFGGSAGNTLLVVSGTNDTLLGSVVIPGPSPVGMAYNPNSHNIYVTNFGSNENPGNTVTRVSTTSNVPDTIITSAVDDSGAVVANGGATLSTSIHITFEGIGDNIVGFQCSLDGSTFSSCTSPFIANQLKAGVRHVFEVRAVNSLGNKDATPATFKWFVLTPAQGIENLISLVKSLHLGHGIQNALVVRLNAASQFLDHKPMIKAGACAEMSGFIQQVQGLARSGQITLSDALQLMNSAQAIRNALGC
jgi:YVTN family beta-propeller protein